MQIPKNTTTHAAILGIYRLLAVFFTIFALYYAQTIVIPLTLAALLTFLLSPLVTRLEKWIGRVLSILLIVLLVFTSIGIAGYIFSRQLVHFGSNFGKYNENIQTKLHKFKLPNWEIINGIENTLSNLKDQLIGDSSSTEAPAKASSSGFNLVDLSSSIASVVAWISGSFINVLWSTGIVVLMVIFMLLNREDIRSRIIKLLGQSKISSTTSTIDEASDRVYNYLYRQFIVNMCFGICVALGMFLIGVPSAILWGCFAAILRFIPYLGSWIAALFPIALSLIITDTWTTPLLTISFFVVLEIFTAYLIEPLYFSGGTGVSSFALILAALFWTWLWGPIGLLLSTPLTVCLVVLGQNMTNWQFLSVLLSQEEALTPAEEIYHRLLSYDASASTNVIESFLKKDSIVSLYDSVLIPIISQTEIDFHHDSIDEEKKDNVYQNINEILDMLNEEKSTVSPSGTSINVLCTPARAIRDELGTNILAQFLARESFSVQQTSKLSNNDLFDFVEKTNPDAICIVVIAPSVLSHTKYLCTNLHKRMPKMAIVVCAWGFNDIEPEVLDKLKTAGPIKITTSLAQAVEALNEISKK